MDQTERVHATLESDAIVVDFRVARLPWEIAGRLIRSFQDTFSKFAPLFVDCPFHESLKIEQTQEQAGSYGRRYDRGGTTLSVDTVMSGGYSVKVRTSLSSFDDHFEAFIADSARLLFPPIEKPRKKTAADLDIWYKEYRKPFEAAGCRVLRDESLTWADLAGLDAMRDRLNRAIFLPLAREGLYRKVADRVLPHRAHVLPRGVLLHGPPGCGKTWSMRVIAGEAGLPVVILPCNAVLTKWYGESEQRMAQVFALCREAGRMILLIDELDALARHRSESHETTARMVTILLSELDGLAGSSEVLLVGSVNDVVAIDRAVVDRFDLRIGFDPPGPGELRAALSYYAGHLSADDLDEIAARVEGWNFRRLARFAEDVVRGYVAGLDLNLLEASEPPLPAKEDYLRALA